MAYVEHLKPLSVYKVLFPLVKRVFVVKEGEDIAKFVEETCEKIKRGRITRKKETLEVTNDVTRQVAVRSIIYIWSVTKVQDMAKWTVAEKFVFPIIEKCKCREKFKEFLYLQTVAYLEGKKTLREYMVELFPYVITPRKRYSVSRPKIYLP